MRDTIFPRMALQAPTEPEFTRILSTFPLVPRARESRRAGGVSPTTSVVTRKLWWIELPE